MDIPETINQTYMLIPHWRIEVDKLTEDDCSAHFERKHGHHPEYIFDRFGYVWMGPVDRKDGSDEPG